MSGVKFRGAMRPQRRRDNPYIGRKRDPRMSGGHPVDWVLVALFLALGVVGVLGWMR